MKLLKNNARVLALALSAMMAVSTAAAPEAEAKAVKPKLSAAKITVEVGGTKKVTVKNAKKVAWSVDKKGKAKISLSKKSKKGVTIKGKAVGKAKVTAKMSYGSKKSLKKVITVNVRKKAKTNEGQTAAPKQTANAAVPTVNPTQAANGTAAPATQTPSQNATEAPTEMPAGEPWLTTWGTAEEKCNVNDSAMPRLALEGTTVRQIIRVTTAGEKIRFRLSNQYGQEDVTIRSMHIAKQIEPTKPDIDTSTDTVVTVGGQEEFKIPKGELIITDAIDFSVDALENIAISCYFGEVPEILTGHRGARATTYQLEGNQVSDEMFENPETTTAWYFLADASLLSAEGGRAVVCFGDSITDGYGTDAAYLDRKPDSYTRWGDYFAKRLQENEATKNVSVINEGIGANSILGSYPTDAGKDRFERDLTQHDGVAYCIILMGVNDLNSSMTDTSAYDKLLPEYQKMVETCHKNGIKVYGAPILPFKNAKDNYCEASEQVRSMINAWMRSAESGMDGIINFDEAVADPNDELAIKSQYTSDGLHPHNGYQAMAEAIDLSMFEN